MLDLRMGFTVVSRNNQNPCLINNEIFLKDIFVKIESRSISFSAQYRPRSYQVQPHSRFQFRPK
jgi:hypothetical protein